MLRLVDAQLVLSDDPGIPPDSAAWQRQSLPDNWDLTRRGFSGVAWYRIAFEVPPERLEISAIFVPRVSMNGVLYVNGERVGGALSHPGRTLRQWYQPQLYVVPRSTLHAGTNEIAYRVTGFATARPGLSAVYFGSQENAEKLWRRAVFWQVTTVQITSAITVGVGILALIAWRLWRTSTAYLYFGLAALLWSLRNTHFLVTGVPIPTRYWEILIATSLNWVLLLLFFFVLRFANLRFVRAERALVAFGCAAPFIVWAAGEHHATAAVSLCYLALLVTGAYIVYVLMRVARTERSVHAVLLVVASFTVLALGAHDWLTHRSALSFSEPFRLHYGAPILFIVVTWNMFQRFATTKAQAEDLNRTLEARVQTKSAELEGYYARLRDIEATRVLSLERERIMRDMHDGIGAQLIAAQQMAQAGQLRPQELESVLQECMDDLRLVIDSLEPVDGDLLALLANLRYRLSDRLARRGVALVWRVAELPRIAWLNPEQAVQVLRIVQEAITNSLKHARANEITLRAAMSADRRAIELRIEDDGCGASGDTAPRSGDGRGLANMRHRAAMLGATLAIEPLAPGWRIRLTIPLERDRR